MKIYRYKGFILESMERGRWTIIDPADGSFRKCTSLKQAKQICNDILNGIES